MSKKKIYRSVIMVEVLSETPVDDAFLTDLSSVNYEITGGECSGVVKINMMNQPLIGEAAVEAVLMQGSSPDFFRMDEEGNDADEILDY